MLKKLSVMAAVAAVMIVAIVPAALADVDRDQVPIAGDSFACGETTITITEGVLNIRVKATANKLSVAVRPVGVRGIDDAGNEVKMVGAETVSGSFNKNATVFHTTFHMNFVAVGGGGLVGMASQLFHVTENANGGHLFEKDNGSCQGPLPG